MIENVHPAQTEPSCGEDQDDSQPQNPVPYQGIDIGEEPAASTNTEDEPPQSGGG